MQTWTRSFTIFRHPTSTRTWQKTWALTTRPTVRLTTPSIRERKQNCSAKWTSARVKEFVCLRSKMYANRLSNNKAKLAAKGVSRKSILRHLQHDDYLWTLQTTRTTTATFTTHRSIKQQLKTLCVTKHCLSAADNKRYITPDVVSTVSYGHYRIKQLQAVDQ